MYKHNLFTNKLKSFDIYGKLQSKYLKPTIIGAICKKKNIKVNSKCDNMYNSNILILF